MIVCSSSKIDQPTTQRSRGQSLHSDNTESTPLAPVEPSADIRGMAGFCQQFYVALLAQRFTPDQALELVGRAVQGVCAGVDPAEGEEQ